MSYADVLRQRIAMSREGAERNHEYAQQALEMYNQLRQSGAPAHAIQQMKSHYEQATNEKIRYLQALENAQQELQSRYGMSSRRNRKRSTRKRSTRKRSTRRKHRN